MGKKKIINKNNQISKSRIFSSDMVVVDTNHIDQHISSNINQASKSKILDSRMVVVSSNDINQHILSDINQIMEPEKLDPHFVIITQTKKQYCYYISFGKQYPNS